MVVVTEKFSTIMTALLLTLSSDYYYHIQYTSMYVHMYVSGMYELNVRTSGDFTNTLGGLLTTR